MTEENNVDTTTETQEQNNNINLTIEQILAAIVSTVGTVNVKIEALLANYSNFQIALNQLEDKSVNFTLVPVQVEEPAEETTESAAE